MVPISLGFSCQTRFAINIGSAAGPAMPFDWTITTRSFVNTALATDGEVLTISENDVSIYTMPDEKCQGVQMHGIYFWHDFPVAEDNRTIKTGWERDIAKVNDKYKKRWLYFKELMRDSFTEKRILFSNTQLNLSQFATDKNDFHNKFGLDNYFFYSVIDSLNLWGAKNYRITFLVRTLDDYETLVDTETKLSHLFDVRFAGEMSLRANAPLVSSIFTTPSAAGALGELCGKYKNGAQIAMRGKTALIYNVNGKLCGEVRPFTGGYLFVFDGLDNTFTARMKDREIYFSDNTQWTLVSPLSNSTL